MTAKSHSHLLRLSVAERLEIIEELWNSIAAEPEELSITDAQRDEIDRRIAEHDRDPSSSVPWAEVRERLRARRRG